MSLVSDSSKIFQRYDPENKRTHGILKFYAEDLNEDDKLVFIEELFSRGVLGLASEIGKLSDNQYTQNRTDSFFYEILVDWINQRIEHSNSLDPAHKNTFIPSTYIRQFKNILVSIRHLNLSDQHLLELVNFVSNCSTSYLKTYLETALPIIVEEYNVKEIERFVLYFLLYYKNNKSVELRRFLNKLILDLAHSPEIFNLSDSFLNELANLKLDYELDIDTSPENLTTTLLITFIIDKSLDLSIDKYFGVISAVLNKLEKSSYDNLIFYKFLKSFGYDFNGFDFKEHLDSLFNKMDYDIKGLENPDHTQESTLSYHVKVSNIYVDIFLFYLEYLEKEDTIFYLKGFVQRIDSLRDKYHNILWYTEYLNFSPVIGTVTKKINRGHQVEIAKELILSKSNSGFDLNDEHGTDNRYSHGFLREEFFKYLSKYKEFVKLDKHPDIHSYICENCDYDIFMISNVNYSVANKLSILTLIPLNQHLHDKIVKFDLKGFFVALELFLIDEVSELLSTDIIDKAVKKVLSESLNIRFPTKYNISFDSLALLELLKEYRPNIYQNLYLEQINVQNVFSELIQAFERDEGVQGEIVSRKNGGFVVDVKGFSCFLPGSHIDPYSSTPVEEYFGRVLDFKILKVNKEPKNIVVSRKLAVVVLFEAERATVLNRLKLGHDVKGIVKNITSYGVFIDLGLGFTGMIHISDLQWRKVEHPSDVVKIGQELLVKITDINDDGSRIQLSYKLTDLSWINQLEKYKENDIVLCTIIRIVEIGIFVSFGDNIEGLIHLSEVSSVKEINYHPISDYYSIGDRIKARIIRFDIEYKIFALSIKRIHFVGPGISRDKLKVGQFVRCKFLSTTDKIVKVEFEGIYGYITVNDLTWNLVPLTKKERYVLNFFKGKSSVTAKILQVKPRNEGVYIKLGVKQVDEEGWKRAISKLKSKTRVVGTIVFTNAAVIVVLLENGIEGVIYISEESGERSSMLQYLTPNTKVLASILSIKHVSKQVKLRYVKVL